MKVGDYVRTKYGIAKYIDDEVKSLRIIVIDKDIANEHYDGYKNVITRDEIIKSSPNIKDLIEAGDYVNGRIVCKNDEENYLYLIGFDADGNFYEDSIKDIKSIVTKEMFSQMEYKVSE